MRDPDELAHELTPLGDVADRVARDERRPADHAVGEERAAARREEVALVATQGEVREAVGAVRLHELGRTLALLPDGGRHALRSQPKPERAEAERADEQRERHFDAARVHVVVVEADEEDRHGDRERRGHLQERDERRRVARRDEVPARAQERDEQDDVDGRLFEVEAFREVRDRRGDHQRDRERPGPALAPREAAREEDHRETRGRAPPSARPPGRPAAGCR